ncbi:hypothetical protein MUN76_06925 [Leucobacter rhizosphaerae]|uniref:Uncharacterized protein n=1 Tax=Leucobacter rhizosphaerae TaxID=2932245 RepID=A0ABY4FZF9_9MICO|nr:hypothetical protein [Leucobacter rhizosphaerae]UOQ61685.1 hypothetical protein MUN76_06925 [Leucobacter rhizosphaerae]
MSDSNTQTPGSNAPQATSAAPAAQTPPSAPVAQAPAQHPQAPQAPKPRKMSTFLKVSIILLAGLTIASISLLFIGQFEGKFERVFSTFALFAVFVLFTALDTRREQKSDWYAPVALIANAYILSLLLIVIWMTRYDSFTLIWEIFWKSLFVILVTRLVILGCQLLLGMGSRTSEVVSRFAFITSVFAVLSGILFTAPVGIEAFDLHIPDLYWKIATALLILTALGLSITLLLRWSSGSEARDAARAAAAQRAAAQPFLTGSAQPFPGAQQVSAQGYPAQQPYPGQQLPAQPYPGQQQPVAQQGQGQAEPAPQLLPWPTFADGRPLPAGPDGQPDFSALQR